MTPAINSSTLVDESVTIKNMESLEPLAAKPPLESPPKKKARTERRGEKFDSIRFDSIRFIRFAIAVFDMDVLTVNNCCSLH